MKTDPLILKRFEELIHAGETVLSTHESSTIFGVPDSVDEQSSEEWGTSCSSFIGRVLGRESEHYQRFQKNFEHVSVHSCALRALGVVKSAYEDYKGGYLIKVVSRIQAEIFDDFLEQAEHLLKDGYFAVAAVIIGAVLEDNLRKICVIQGIALSNSPKLDAMNAELAKKGVYDKLLQKKITWLADIRNKAAHGKWTEFTAADVEEMLRATRRFVEEHV